jgi:predicted nucleic acid-binding Zn ribbon protein
MHIVKETDMLTAKLDLLMKRLDERANEKEMQGTVKTMVSHRPWSRHSGNDCPKTREDAAYINNGFRP